MFEPISARNPLVPHLRRLSRRRSARVGAGRYLVEGPTLVAAALDAGVEVEVLVRDAGAVRDPAVEAVGERAALRGTRLVEVPEGVLARMTDAVTPQGVVGVAVRATTSLDDVLAGVAGGADHPDRPDRRARPVLVLVEVGDPGNAGTLVRSAEAAGCAAVVFTSGSVDPLGPKAVRSSAGSVFHVPVVEGVEADAALVALGALAVRRVGTAARGGTALEGADLTGPLAVVLGSEAHGLPDALTPLLDELLTIPMEGRAESLNVAMAGTLVLFEAARQRRLAG